MDGSNAKTHPTSLMDGCEWEERTTSGTPPTKEKDAIATIGALIVASVGAVIEAITESVKQSKQR